MTKELQVGDKVIMDESYRFFFDICPMNPKGVVGIISEIDHDQGGIVVDWSNGHWNAYCEKEIIKVDSATKSDG